MTDSLSGDHIRVLRESNKLVYDKPFSASCISQRALKGSAFTSNIYSAGTLAQCRINSSQSVWGPSCFLRFDVKLLGTVAADVQYGGDNGSVMSLFKDYRLTHRSGQQLEYVQSVDVDSVMTIAYEISADQRRQLAGMIGSSEAVGVVQPDLTSTVAGVTRSYCVPMGLLCPIFSNNQQFIPSGLLSGALLEFQLNTAAAGLMSANGDVTYQILNATIIIDEATTYDSITKSILVEETDSQKKGLQFSWYSKWNFSSGNVPTGSSQLDLLKSVSELSSVTITIRNSTNAQNINLDKTLFINDTVTGAQFKLGSFMYPWQPMQSKQEQWAHLLVCQDAFPKMLGDSDQKAIAANYDSFASAAGVGCLKMSFENSVPLDLSGSPTNNSRVLSVAWNQSAGITQNVQSFFKFYSVLNVMNDSCVLQV